MGCKGEPKPFAWVFGIIVYVVMRLASPGNCNARTKMGVGRGEPEYRRDRI
jgi:hypothetical protein